MGKITVSCAGDSELAKQVHDYLQPQIRSLTIIEDEIEVGNASKKQVAGLLDSFIKSKNMQGYSVTGFGDMLVVGILTDPVKVGMETCEFCNFFTPYQDEMRTHRMVHAGFPI